MQVQQLLFARHFNEAKSGGPRGADSQFPPLSIQFGPVFSKMVGATGFEPAISSSQRMRDSRLRYAPEIQVGLLTTVRISAEDGDPGTDNTGSLLCPNPDCPEAAPGRVLDLGRPCPS